MRSSNIRRMRLEEKISSRAGRERIQQKIAVLLFRFTTQRAGMAFAPEKWIIKHLGLKTATTRNPAFRIRQALKRMEEKGSVVWEKKDNGWRARLTEKGAKHAERIYAAESLRLHTPRTWDGRWRIVIFDVWERRRAVRNKLRQTLAKSGFLRVQDSVWLYPYDCEALVALLRTDLRLGTGMLYLVVEGMEHDARFRAHFRLLSD